jgi:stage II sporulation protein D
MDGLSLYPARADSADMARSFCIPALLLAAATASCGPVPQPAIRSASAATSYVRVEVLDHGRLALRELQLEDYVETVVLSEIAPPVADPVAAARMFEVQAVISRTYALANLQRHGHAGFDLCSTSHCQVYDPARAASSRWADAGRDAVRRTTGVVLSYNGAPAEAVFHADCGGHTSAAAAVWGRAGRPYLLASPDDGPAQLAHAAWRSEVASEALVRAFNSDVRTRIGSRLDSIEVLDRDGAGRAERVALHGEREAIVRGEDLREAVNRLLGPRSVRSTWLDVQRDGMTFVFTGRGFGHGVGLCQAGALARIRAGATVTAVLQRYYPGTTLVLTRPPRG